MINRAVDARMKAFYDSIREKPPVYIKRHEAARLLSVSLPTLDAYGKHQGTAATVLGHLAGTVAVTHHEGEQSR